MIDFRCRGIHADDFGLATRQLSLLFASAHSGRIAIGHDAGDGAFNSMPFLSRAATFLRSVRL